MVETTGIIDGLSQRIGTDAVMRQPTRDEVDTAWVSPGRLR